MRKDLPTGTVTFLFTDVEGSTRLLDELGVDAYGALLAEHHRVCREAWAAYGGVEIDTAGNAFFVAFSRPSDALAAAADAQHALALLGVPVRMGVHTGEVVLGETGYVGMEVHRAARICSAGHGGQVLISQSTRGLAEDDLPDGIALRDAGEHRLKDLEPPHRLSQLVVAGLPHEFPALRTLENRPMALYERRYEDSVSLFVDSLESAVRHGVRANVALSLRGLAASTAAKGDLESSARMLGAAEAIDELLGEKLQPYERAGFEEAIATVAAGADEPEIAAAWAAGRAMSEVDAADYALAKVAEQTRQL